MSADLELHLSALGVETSVLEPLLRSELPDGVLLHDQERILFANPALARLVQRPVSDTLSGVEGMARLIHADSRETWRKWLAKRRKAEGHPLLEISLAQAGTGAKIHVEVATTPIAHPRGELFLSVLRDITERQHNLDDIRQRAHFDTLTELPNRTLFMDRLTREIIRAERSHSHVALMFVDLDRFKWVNDTMGHAAGDQLLKEVAARLLACSRRSDTVARLGGDEFTLILPDMTKGDYAERVAGQILDKLAQPFILSGQEAFISGSVGITVYPDDARTVEDLLKNADGAMYRAKHDGRNAYRFFTPDMQAEAQARISMEKDLRRCLTHHQLELNFQPIVHLDSGQLAGSECFLRWNHPTRGRISPDAFVYMAEEIGMTQGIAEWTLLTACRQAKAWQEQNATLPFLVTVNLSCVRCRNFSFDERIAAILRQTGLAPQSLVLEITENILSADADRAMAMLFNLKDMGVKLWLDDFGTGHSSLSLLKRLPLDGIKIDRTFVPDVVHDKDTAALVEAIISLGRSLNLTIIAEGIEGEQERNFLQQHGCLLGQGYLFGKPVEADPFRAWFGKTFAI